MNEAPGFRMLVAMGRAGERKNWGQEGCMQETVKDLAFVWSSGFAGAYHVIPTNKQVNESGLCIDQ